jgi:TolB-like protein
LSDSFFTELKRRNVFKVGIAYLVLAWVVVQVTDSAVPALGMPEWVNTVVFYFGMIGFPFVIFFSWVFEVTPEGVKRESEITAEESVGAHTGRKLDFMIIGLLVIALVYFIYQNQFNQPPGAEYPSEISATSESAKELPEQTIIHSIAVLPFVDMSNDKNQQYFSDGISEEILNVLVKISSLKVVSRTSSFQFKDRDMGIPEIAKQLNVRFVLEGSVRKAGSTLRITAQLIDTQNDHHLWSETYDRPLTIDNVFVIQDEISHSIVKALAAEIGIEEQADFKSVKLTDNLSAYELFLEARPLFQARVDLNKVDTLLLQAVEQDPKFSKAWGILAANQGLMADYGYTSMSREDSEVLTIEYANRALAIEPNSGTAIAALANMRLNSNEEERTQYDWSDIIVDFKKVLVIEPANPQALNWLGLAYNRLGRLDLALENFDNCVKYEPYYVPCLENQMVVSAILHGDVEAVKMYKRSLDLGASSLIYAPFPSLARLNEELAFKIATNHGELLKGWRQHDKLYQAYQNPTGNHNKLLKDIQMFLASKTDRSSDALADLLTPIGAFDLKPLFRWDEIHKTYRQSKQFKSTMKNMGVYKYWVEYGFPKQCRPLPIDDFVCD